MTMAVRCAQTPPPPAYHALERASASRRTLRTHALESLPDRSLHGLPAEEEEADFSLEQKKRLHDAVVATEPALIARLTGEDEDPPKDELRRLSTS